MLIMGFGDSITAGIHLPEQDHYLSQLGELLACSTINAGIPGQTTSDAMPELENTVLAHSPDVVIIQFGMNDHVAKSEQEAKVSMKQFEENLLYMVNTMKDRGIRPLLCTVHPIIEGDSKLYYYARHPQEWYDSEGAMHRIEQYNEIVKKVATRCSCMLADVNSYWKQQMAEGMALTDLLRTIDNSGSDDGVHPTAIGQKLYAACIANEILKQA